MSLTPFPFSFLFFKGSFNSSFVFLGIFNLFRAGLRHEGLRSAQRLNNIPPNFITSVRSNFRKGNYHGFDTSTPVSAVRKTSPEQILHTIDLYQLSTHILVVHTNLRSAMMFLYLLVSSLSLGITYGMSFWRWEGAHTKKSQLQLQLLKISRCNLDSNCYVCNHFSV